MIAGRYRVLRQLGRGGMGEVFEVEDTGSGARLALKTLLDPGRRDRYLRLFEREYFTLSRLSHPAIVRAFEYGVADGRAYYTMELLDGADLRSVCPASFERAAPLLRELAGALALLHSRHLLYRDLNTKNVRITADGHAKLMDFGALSHFGMPRDVVGTPPMIPPEALGDAPLDQRADLFSLGALAYYVLSGRFAFPSRTIEALPRAWSQAPVPLRELVEVPEQLDALVMGMLSLNPQGRPQSAAEVIDRLDAAAGLPPRSEEEGARRNLPRPALVGRDDAMEQLTKGLSAPARGLNGMALLLSGASGVGKTRLLTECAIQAQLLGLRVLQVVVREHAPEDELLRRVVSALHTLSPGAVTERVAAEAPALRPFLPSAEGVSLVPPAAHALHGAAARARALSDLRTLLGSLSEERGLCVLVDDAHLASDEDLGLLALLSDMAADGPVAAVMAVRRTGAGPSAPERALARYCETVELGALGARSVEALVRSVFGPVPGQSALASWLHRVTGGTPALCVATLRHLVDARIIRYLGGTWVLPQSLDERALPSDPEALVQAQLSQLQPKERMLAEALGVCRGTLSLGLCQALSDGPAEAIEALDSLTRSGVLLGSGDGYVFRSELIRSALRAGIPPDGRQALHRRIADLLLSEPGGQDTLRLEAAHHLVEAGDPLRGASLLVAEGLDFADRAGRLRGAIPDLEAGLLAYEVAGRGAEARIQLLLPLMVAGMYSERRLVEQYGDATLEALLELCGLRTARPAEVMASPFVVPLLLCATTLVSVAQACQDPEGARRTLSRVELLRSHKPGSVPRSVYDFCAALVAMATGDYVGASDQMVEMLAQIEGGGQVASVPEHVVVAYRGGICNGLGMMCASQADPAALTYAERLESLGHPRYAVYAEQVRALHHAYRGELRGWQRHQRRADLLSLQGAGSWRAEAWMPSLLLLSQHLDGDTVALKRTGDQLETLAHDIPTLAVVRDLARMAHAVERGQPREALELHGPHAQALAPSKSAHWPHAAAICAQALSALGDHRMAQALCDEALSALRMPEGSVAVRVWLCCQRAHATHALGEQDAARDGLERLLHAHSMSDNPLILGHLHRALAQLAIRRRDAMRFEHHRQAVEQHFGSTENPALMARYQALVAESAALRRR